MAKKIFLLGIFSLGILLGFASFSSAQTNVSGTISQNTTWTLAGSPYIVIGNITVLDGITLTIQPGVEIKAAGYYSLGVRGTLTATGTSTQRIKFTSNQSAPTRGDWRGVFVDSYGSVALNFLEVEYAEYGIEVQSSNPTVIQNSIFSNNNRGVYTGWGNTTIQTSTFQNNLDGVFANNTVLTFTNNNVTNNEDGMFFYCTSLQLCISQVNNNIIAGNTAYNVNANHNGSGEIGIRINAENNWWGTTNVGAIAASIYDYQESEALPTVDFTPYLDAPNGNPINQNILYGATNGTLTLAQSPYLVVGNLLVGPGQTLTIQPGVELKFAGNYFFKVYGTLNAAGTASQRVKFTSNQTTPAMGDWRGMVIYSANTTLDYLQVEYADYGIDIVSSVSTILQNSILQHNNRGIFVQHDDFSELRTIQGNIFQNNNFGIFIDNTRVTATDNLITNNVEGVRIICGDMFLCTARFNNNSILNNTSYNLSANHTGPHDASSITIDAENNWWGTTDPLLIAAGIQDYQEWIGWPKVDFDPYLFSSNGQPLVTGVSISQLFFDPFNNQTTSIQYNLVANCVVTIKVFNYSTHSLVRTLTNGAQKIAGPNTEVWDGKNDTNQPLPPGIYNFTIEAVTGPGVIGGYSPPYLPEHISISSGTVFPVNFDPYSGEVMSISYMLSSPSLVTLRIGDLNSVFETRTLFIDQPRPVGTSNEIWDGRDNSGNIANVAPYSAVLWARSLPAGITVIEDPAFQINSLVTNPYVIRPLYNEVAEIKYQISQMSLVTVTVEDSNSIIVRTLITNQQQTSGEHTLIWDGKDGQGKVVNAPGHYIIRVRSQNPNGGGVRIMTGNLSIMN